MNTETLVTIILLITAIFSGCSNKEPPTITPTATSNQILQQKPDPTSDQTKEIFIPMGRLGYPMGTYLTISGKIYKRDSKPQYRFTVDTINGVQLKSPVDIYIRNIKETDLPKEEMWSIRGYESGEMIGIPNSVAKAENIPLKQPPWTFHKYFIMTSIVQTNSISESMPTKQKGYAHGQAKETIMPMGHLGYPLGTYLTIEGVTTNLDKARTQIEALIVDKINETKLITPTGIWISNIGSFGLLPKGERCVLKGYESGQMIGVPDEVAKTENLPPNQACWQFYKYFIITSIVQPKILEKK